MEKIHSLLLQAIAGEAAAEVRYREFARQALQEGYGNIANLFTALSRAEAIHLANHRRALEKNGYQGTIVDAEQPGETGTTRDNLDQAFRLEQEEYKHMYPALRRQIQKDYGDDFNVKIALLSIRWASESEEGHFRLLKEALDAANAGNDTAGGNYYLCSVCGNIHFSADFPGELCKVCGHDTSFFTKIEVAQ